MPLPNPTPVRRGFPALLAVVAVLAAVVTVSAGLRPVTSMVGSVAWSALAAVIMVFAAGRASAAALVWLTATAGVVGVFGDPVAIVAGGVCIVLAVLLSVQPRTVGMVRLLGGLAAVTALSHGPTYAFTGVPTFVALVATAPVVVAALRTLRGPQRRWVRRSAVTVVLVTVLIAGAAVAAVALGQADLRSGIDASRRGLDQASSGETELAAASFIEASAAFTAAEGIVTGPLVWASAAVPVLAQQMEAISELTVTGAATSRTAAVSAGEADWRSLSVEGGRFDLGAITALQRPTAQASAALVDAVNRVGQLRSPWLVAPFASEIRRLEAQLVDASRQASIADEALTVAPELLGGTRPMRYLLAFGTPAELRDGGGYVGSFGVMTASGGLLQLEDTGPISELASDGEPWPLELPPDWPQRYGGLAVGQFPGNLAASPDWPQNTDVAAQIAGFATGETFDGVLYADPLAMAALLRLTGPVRVPGLSGTTLNTDNVVQYLLADQYVAFDGADPNRKEVLGDSARAVFDALVSRPLPDVERLTKALGPAVTGGHLRLSMVGDGPGQTLLERVGLAGAWRTAPGADHLSLRSANQSMNKIDWYLHRTIEADIVFEPATGITTSTITVQLRNDSPSSGAPEYTIGNGFGLPTGTNRDLLSLYTPLDLVSVTIDGIVAGTQNQRQFDAPVYSLPVTIPPGATVSVVFTLQGRIDPGPDYRLDLLTQPLTRPDEVTVRVSRFAGGTPPITALRGPVTGDRALRFPLN